MPHVAHASLHILPLLPMHAPHASTLIQYLKEASTKAMDVPAVVGSKYYLQQRIESPTHTSHLHMPLNTNNPHTLLTLALKHACCNSC